MESESGAKLVECVPNFSEGRCEDVIDRIVQSMDVPGVQVLHRTSDPDHNRTVVTLLGDPDPLLDAVYAGIQQASELINMEEHRGVHPRIGAADVVPFVPIKGVQMDECVVLARRLGQRVGDELDLPVYLYGAAAIRLERSNLANVRRGEYEGLKEQITSPLRYPDYGPARLGPAGAVVIGARNPLIAFNVFLTTDDVTIAQAIAKKIRFSSGGLPGVKALGLTVSNRAQVSMNLTDYKRTPVHRVVELIRTEAAQHGTTIYKSELIGLIPHDALIDAATWYLQLHDFEDIQILSVL